jgi:hypothetical protein
MEMAIVLSLLVIAAAGIGFGFLLRSLSADPQTLPATADWIDNLSVEKYRPMLRLLSDEELKFLTAQPGYSAKMARQFRAQRCEIFRGYLSWLQSDFSRICTAIQVLMVQSQDDRPDLAALLVRQKATFAASLVAIHGRLILYRFGISGASVDGLIATFDSLRVELRQMVPASACSNA